MKLTYWLCVAVLGLGLAGISPVYAQDEGNRAQSDEKKDQQEDKKADEKKDAKQDEKQDEKKDKEVQDKELNKDEHQEKDARQMEQQKDEHQQKASQGGQIPQDKFRANFGREHTFVIERPVIVSGQPRFQHAGYWFVMAQPWPAGWAYTDVVYVDYIGGGYYLLCPAHPGVQISLSITL
ncbi:MAG TPA: hypothetical protein VF753_07025 [Terriglobales bacterium]